VISPENQPSLSLAKLYRRAIVINVANPKVAIFFLAFLPQFVETSRGSLGVQLFQLGTIFIGTALVVFGTIAWGAAFLSDWLRRTPKTHVIMNRVAGVIFVGMALRLATVQQ